MKKRANSPNTPSKKKRRIDSNAGAVHSVPHKKNEEAIALGTEEEEVGVEFDGSREHHCWTDRELFKDTGDF